MEIIISEIPAEGLYIEAVFPPEIIDLDADDSIRPTGQISCSATIFAFEDLITFHGSLSGDFELQCCCCLEMFPYRAEFDDWTSDLDLEPRQENFDLATVVREDFLLSLPASPRCDELVEGRICAKAGVYDGTRSAVNGDPESPQDVWGALDTWK